jgi:hypothetical protein
MKYEGGSMAKRIVTDYTDIKFDNVMVGIFEAPGEDPVLALLIEDTSGTIHETQLSCDQANDIRDTLAMGVMRTIDFDSYDNVVRHPKLQQLELQFEAEVEEEDDSA